MSKRNIQAEPTIGVVVNCQLVNVRSEPSLTAEVMCTEAEGAELMIDLDASTDDFYNVCTVAGIGGYCYKPYVEIKF